MDDLLSEFLTETTENLSVLDVELVQLEQNPNDPNLLGNIFRLVHTIKGTCGFLGLPRLERVAHAGENVLGRFRDGALEVTPTAVSLILESLDRIKAIIGGLEAEEKEPAGDDSDLVARLNVLAEGGSPPAAEGEAAAPEPAAEPEMTAPVAAELDDLDNDPLLTSDEPAEAAPPAEPEPEVEPEPEPAPPPAAPPAPAAAAKPAAEARPAAEAKESQVANQTIRVNVDLLENLMTMVSELVLTRNQLLQILRSHKDSEFNAPLQRLNHVTSELQEGVMKTRMQPIGNAWAKLPRLIRDLSQELGRKIELQMFGQDTELDRQVLELIKDPLTHMVRNSADHGIEPPAVRLAAGKSEIGKVRLNAYHEGGHIIIEISDDGKGLSVDKLRAKAVTNGLISEADAASMSDSQVHQLIFKAGFSTAEQVTSVSGRGVGMDVVRTNIEKIGGTVELKSELGRGTTFMIKIPLTLAIVSALVVECAKERFAIPQISVVELVRVGGHSEHSIELLNGAAVLRLRNRLLPLVSLRKLLQLEAAEGEGTESFVVVTQVGAYSFGIIVDRVFDTEEIVVKPVAPILRSIEMFSGNTILGDGSVIMILDPNGIAQATGEITVAEGMAGTTETQRQATGDEAVALLLFRAGDGAPKAVPLALVSRLEDIEEKNMELSNGRLVVQYRGKLMPLIPFDGMFHPGGEDGRKPVLVFSEGERSMGLIVDEIVDIVEEKLNVELAGEQSGLIGSAIVDGRATDVIDAGAYLTQAYHDWFGANGEAFESDEKRSRILLVDDSPFFCNMLTPLLTVSGYEVTAVSSAEQALAMAEEGQMFDAIISDIEMPGMSGFDFAERVRAEGPWQALPLIALSSHATPRDLDRGREAGFTDYVAKFDRDLLLNSLAETLNDVYGQAA